MFIVRNYKFINPVIATISVSIALFVASCGDSKTSQCNRLITAVNQGNSLIENNKGKQVTTSLQLSQDLKNITQSIQKLKLNDPELQKYQTNFVNVFDQLSQAIATAGKALGETKNAEDSNTGRQKIYSARKDIETTLTSAAKTAGQKSDNFGNQLNQYCSQSQ
ncbi:MAG: hypothetical protein EAZ76_12555 [Nostocales cyanobacterium]|nr:MAG: hypothetical protein EAZ87_16190 [Nostocales cyanobacterium]TAF13046.1 MAG: hypothetical protein EAZ76_12555 [Nostocales cyanobacterium]